jgi:hypothetical protein
MATPAVTLECSDALVRGCEPACEQSNGECYDWFNGGYMCDCNGEGDYTFLTYEEVGADDCRMALTMQCGEASEEQRLSCENDKGGCWITPNGGFGCTCLPQDGSGGGNSAGGGGDEEGEDAGAFAYTEAECLRRIDAQCSQ